MKDEKEDPETKEICIICDDEEVCGKTMDECMDRNVKDTLPPSTAVRRVPIKETDQGTQEEKSCKTCGNSYCREMVLEYKLHKCPENGCSDWKPKTPTIDSGDGLIKAYEHGDWNGVYRPEHVDDSSFIGPLKDTVPVGEEQLAEFREVLKMLEDKFEAGVEENTDDFIRCDKTKSKYTIHSFDIHIEINTEDD